MPHELGTVVMTWVFKIALAVGAIFVALFLGGSARRLVEAALRRSGLDETITRFAGTSARWSVLVLGGIAILGTFGIETTSFAALLAGAGLAIGLALQGTLSNVSSGVLLLMFRPFRVGDVVSVAGQTGKVDAIDIFTTTMDTPDNRRIILPNAAVFGSTIENISHHETRRITATVGTDYAADIDKTRKTLLSAIGKVEGALDDPEPAVVLTGLGASSVDWQVRVWCKSEDYFGVLEETTVQVKKALDKAKIGIPYSTLDVNIVAGAVP